jgi:hypothetical protein
MTNLLPTICLIVGLLIGGGLLYAGFVLGFKASYSIRQVKGGEVEDGQTLFHQDKEPAEFGLLEPKKKSDEAKEFEKL